MVAAPPRDSRKYRQKHRPRFYILAEILKKAEGGSCETRIMYGVGLSFSQIKKCLSLLLDCNLLQAVETPRALGKFIYKPTDKGLRYLQRYRKIAELLKEGEGNKVEEASSLRLIRSGSRVIISE